MKIKAELLNNIKINRFSGLNTHNSNILIIGGVHGNEIQGIRGSTLLRDYFFDPENILTPMILARATIVIIPVINVVGYLAKARSCPNTGAEIEYTQGTVQIKTDEKFSMRIPINWHDPNRGWDDNDSLVCHQLKWLLPILKPSLIIFNHDWALPQGKIKIYTPTNTEEETTILHNLRNAEQIFQQFYPKYNLFGDRYNFVELVDYEQSNTLLNSLISREFSIPVLVTENDVYSKQSPHIHLGINLFILAKYLGIQLEDDQLIEIIMKEILENNRLQIVK